MKKFIDLQEKPRTIAFTFGRFNPPTIGHEKLLNKLKSVRADDTFIYASHSQNPEKDPLQYVKKIAYMKQSFPKYAKNIVVSKARTVFEIVVEIQKKYNVSFMSPSTFSAYCSALLLGFNSIAVEEKALNFLRYKDKLVNMVTDLCDLTAKLNNKIQGVLKSSGELDDKSGQIKLEIERVERTLKEIEKKNLN